MASLLEVKDNRGSIKGELSSGDKSDDSKLTLKGEAKAGSTVRIYDNGELIGSTKADKNGKWSFNTPKLEEGSHSFRVAEEGKKSKDVRSSDNFELTVDQTVDEATDLTLKDQDSELLNGAVHGNGELELSGKAEAGAKVEVINNGAVIAEVIVDENGQWNAALNLSDGEHSLQTRVTDEAGNSTDVSASAIKLNIDKNVANQPAVNSGADEVILPPGIIPSIGDPTNDNTPVISGSATVGSTVTLSVFNGNTGEIDNYGPITVDSSGTWSFQITNPLPDGVALFRAKASNDVGDSYTALELPIDTEIPEQPTIDYAIDNVGLYQNDLNDEDSTDDDVVELHGTAEANSLVIIYSNGAFIGFTKALGDGSWNFTPTSPMPEGDNSFVVTSTDSAGNASAPSEEFNLTLDRSVEDPVITHLVDDQGATTGNASAGQTTDDGEPLIIGEAEANALVDVYIDGNLIDQVSADDKGRWELQVDSPLAEGSHEVTAIQIDVAGNQSGESSSFEFDVLYNQGPDANDDSATTAVGRAVSVKVLKNDTDPDGDAIELVKITKQGGYGHAEIDKSGKVTYTPDNAVRLSEPVTDKVIYQISDGKGGFDKAVIKITLLPEHTKPTIDLATSSDRGWSDKDNITNDSTPTLQGDAAYGTVVTIYRDGVKIGTTKTNEHGRWKFTTKNIDDGDHNFSVSTKQLGQTLNSKDLKVTIDTEIYARADFTADTFTSAGGILLQLTANEKVRFTLRDDNNHLQNVNDTIDGSEARYISFANSAIFASHTYNAHFSDRAGNKSSNSDSFVYQNPPPVDPTAALKDGGYIVTFFKPALNAEDGFDVYAQRYNADGSETGPAFVVNSHRVDDQMVPDVVGLEDGGYVVSWQSYGQDGDAFGIYAQRFDSNDQAVGNEFLVNESTASDQHRAEITSLENGGFVISWVSEASDGTGRTIFARFYDENSDPVTAEMPLNDSDSSNVNYPSISNLSNGNVVITWESGNDEGVQLQLAIYSPAGELLHFEPRLTASDNWQMQAHIDGMEDGGFAISWLEASPGGKLQTQIQVFDANGEALNDAVTVAENVESARPEVAGLKDGTVLVSWLEGGEVQFANYSADGSELLSTTSIEADQSNDMIEPHALALNDGGFLITWVELSENSPVAVFGMQYDANGEAVGERFVVEPLSDQLVSNALMPSESSPIELNYQLGTEEEIQLNAPQDAEYDFSVAEYHEGLDLSDVFSGEDTAAINFASQQFSSNAISDAEMDWFSLDAAYNFGSEEGIFSLEDLQTAHLGI
ncbi:MAG: Ig-like domain-containing protein [Cellvibrionaceae bacterium]|nr:Ig-like domain-containing protein [Cellvibrionaceae bacterium]